MDPQEKIFLDNINEIEETLKTLDKSFYIAITNSNLSQMDKLKLIRQVSLIYPQFCNIYKKINTK